MKIARVVDRDDRIVWAAQQQDGQLLRLEGHPLQELPSLTDKLVAPVRWLPPIEPAAIIAVGLNYREHAVESNKPVPAEPIVFMKNPGAAVGHRAPVRIPKVCRDEVDYEAELAVVIGRACRDVPEGEALEYVAGYTAANDVSARVWQLDRCGGQWIRGKSFDTFAPLGPVLVTPDEIPNPNDLAIRCELNGQTMQDGATSDMIFDVQTLICFLSQDTTLLPGTVLMTGTPAGIGWAREPRRLLQAGDEVVVEIEHIGRLSNPVE